MDQPFLDPVEGLCVDVGGYLKWRKDNGHVGLVQLWDEPRIWVPSGEESQDDRQLTARLRPQNTAPLTFDFLDLPAELRHGVYEALFNPFYGNDSSEEDNFKHVDITASVNDITPSLKRALSSPILRTSRQLRRESLHIFFSRTTWRVTSPSDFSAFFNLLGPSCRASLRTIWIEDLFFPGAWDPHFTRSLVRIINSLPGLKKLFIDLDINHCAEAMPADGTIDLVAYPNLTELAKLRGLDELKLSFAGMIGDRSLAMSWADREKYFQDMLKKVHRLSPGSQIQIADMLEGFHTMLWESVHLPRHENSDEDESIQIGDVGHTLPLLVQPFVFDPKHGLGLDLLETEDEAETEESDDESMDGDSDINGDVDYDLMAFESMDDSPSESSDGTLDDDFDEDFDEWL